MNFQVWLLAAILAAVTGGTLRIFWPQVSPLGILGIAAIVLVLSVRLAEAWRESK